MIWKYIITIGYGNTKVQFYGCYNDSISTDKYFVKDKNGQINNNIEILFLKEMEYYLLVFIRLRSVLPKNMLKMVYKTILVSIWNYGIIVCSGTFKNVIGLLEIYNKRILKIIINKPPPPWNTELHIELNENSVFKHYCLNLVKYSINKRIISLQETTQKLTRENYLFMSNAPRRSVAMVETCPTCVRISLIVYHSILEKYIIMITN